MTKGVYFLDWPNLVIQTIAKNRIGVSFVSLFSFLFSQCQSSQFKPMIWS